MTPNATTTNHQVRLARHPVRQDVVRGIETFPEALLRLFRGDNFGKLVLQVAEA